MPSDQSAPAGAVVPHFPQLIPLRPPSPPPPPPSAMTPPSRRHFWLLPRMPAVREWSSEGRSQPAGTRDVCEVATCPQIRCQHRRSRRRRRGRRHPSPTLPPGTGPGFGPGFGLGPGFASALVAHRLCREAGLQLPTVLSVTLCPPVIFVFAWHQQQNSAHLLGLIHRSTSTKNKK